MSGSSYGRGLGGKQFYIVVALWLILVILGGLCTWYGWFGSAGESSQPEPAPTEVAVVPTSAPTAVPPTATPAPEVFGYGIATNAGMAGDISYSLGQVQNLGLGWVKQQVKWGGFESAPGQMDWSGFDRVVDAANQRGVKVMFSVVDAPDWAHTSYTDANPEGAPPDDLAVFADFLGRLVDRYRGRIHAIEVWNEQNLDREWDTADGVNPERYVEMLRLAYQTIKSRDPNIIVISGALSPVGASATDPDNSSRVIYMDDFVYFDRMVAAGFLDYCDCVGAHHNGYNIPPDVATGDPYQDDVATFRGFWDNPTDHEWSFKTTLWGYHDRIAAAGSDKPLCVTEFGWASAEGFDGYPPGFEFALDNTLQEQADWDVQAFQLMRQWGFVRLAFLWNLDFSQLGHGPQDPNAPYALIDFQGIARPAYGAIGAMPKP
jgi:hypothetical protein